MRRAFILVGLLALVGCADSKNRDSAECDMRSVESALSGLEKSRHKNLCMIARGYKRTTYCNTGLRDLNAAYCFAPKWYFWEDEENLSGGNSDAN